MLKISLIYSYSILRDESLSYEMALGSVLYIFHAQG